MSGTHTLECSVNAVTCKQLLPTASVLCASLRAYHLHNHTPLGLYGTGRFNSVSSMHSDINYAPKLKLCHWSMTKSNTTFFASNQEVTRPNSQSFLSWLTLLSKDLMAMDAILLHMAESSLTVIRQRGMKNIPQWSWRSPCGKVGTSENGSAMGMWQHRARLPGSTGKPYLREGLKQIGDHFQSGFSSRLMFITRARMLGRLSILWLF